LKPGGILDITKVKALLKLLEESELETLEIEVKSFGGHSIRVKKECGKVVVPTAGQSSASRPVILQDENVAKPATNGQKVSDENAGLVEITSPIVGTFYRAPAPDAEPYIKIGDRVEVGQVVCIVEAMKLMNEIQSEIKGIVAKILVENAKPVEFGQVMFLIKPE
jgi:acetyl-CoA carboxylase biotin carboxyl carrier protein